MKGKIEGDDLTRKRRRELCFQLCRRRELCPVVSGGVIPTNGDPATVIMTPSMDAPQPHASQGRLSVIVVSIISGEPSDPRAAPILRLKLLSELSMGHAAGRAAAPKGLGSTPLRTRHQPTHPTNSPDRDSGRHGVPNRT